MAENRSAWAVGYTYFAAIMMVFLGAFHALAGLTGIIRDEAFVVTKDYVIQLDTTQWGWIHLIVGLIVLFAGFSLLSGAIWARTVGVIMAIISGIVAFVWIPVYPVWGILLVVIAVGVVWALTAHGRDVVE